MMPERSTCTNCWHEVVTQVRPADASHLVLAAEVADVGAVYYCPACGDVVFLLNDDEQNKENDDEQE